MVHWFRIRSSRIERPQLTPEGVEVFGMDRIEPSLLFRQSSDGRLIMTAHGFAAFQHVWLTERQVETPGYGLV